MWSALTLVAALGMAPAQGGALKMANERFTYGILGATRDDAKFLPGDYLFLSFDIEGLQVDDRGKTLYSMLLEFLDKNGKSIYKKADEASDLEAINTLGGNRLPAFAHSPIGNDVGPGEYTIRVTVTDRSAKKSQTLSRKFEVLPKGFGIVRTMNGYASQSFVPAPPIGVVGQALIYNMGVAGFERDRTSRQPNLVFEARVLDENGKPVVAKPDVITANKDVPENFSVYEVPFVMQLNRPGKFTVELKVTDQLTKKSATRSLPLTVLDAKP